MPNKSFLEKLRSQNDIMMTHHEANQEQNPQNAVQDSVVKIGEESRSMIERFWSDDLNLNDELMDSAKRFHVDVNLKKTEDQYASEKELVQKNLKDLSELDSSRTNKSRTGHMEKASAAYKIAAQKRASMSKNKSEGKTYSAVLDAEAAIKQIIQGEKEIVKATGTKNQSETYELSRLEVKECSMLFNLYTSALTQAAREGNLTPEDEEKLQLKISQIQAEMAEKSMQFETLLAYRDAKINLLTDEARVMSSEQIKKYMDAYGIADKALVQSLTGLLDKYHGLDPKYREERMEALSKVMLHLETQTGQHMNDRKEMQTLITLLRSQILFLQNKKKTTLEQDMDSYEEITNEELLETAEEHKKYLTDEDIKDVYGYYRGKRINETHGYFMTGEGWQLNAYLKDKEAYKNDRWNQIKERDLDPMKADPDYTEEEVREYEQTKMRQQEKHIEGKEKTIAALDKCLEHGKMKGKKKLRRIVDKAFLTDKLNIDLNDINGQAKSQEEIVSEANKHYGTIISNHQYTSTSNKLDERFLEPSRIMLTMLCEDGQKCFYSENFEEGEILLPKGVRYVLVGAKNHEANGTTLPVTSAKFSEDGKNVTFDDKTTDFRGIELIVKVIKEDKVAQKSSVQKDDMKDIHISLNQKSRERAQTLLNENSKKDSKEMVAVKNNVRAVEDYLKQNIPQKDKVVDHLRNGLKLYSNAIAACDKYLKEKNPYTDSGTERYNLVDHQKRILVREKDVFLYGLQAIKLNFANAPQKTSDVINIGRDTERRIKHISPESMEDYTINSIDEGLEYLNNTASEGEEKLEAVKMSVKLQKTIESEISIKYNRVVFKMARDRAEKASKDLGLDGSTPFYCIKDENFDRLQIANKKLSNAKKMGTNNGVIGQKVYGEILKCLKVVDSYQYMISLMNSEDQNLAAEITSTKEKYQKVIDRATKNLSKYETILNKASYGVRLSEAEAGSLNISKATIDEYQKKADVLRVEAGIKELEFFGNEYKDELTEEERQLEIAKEGSELNIKENQAKSLESVINNQRSFKLSKFRAAAIKGQISMKEEEARSLSEFLEDNEDANAELLKNYSGDEEKRDTVLAKIFDDFINTDFKALKFNTVEEGINKAETLERLTNRLGAMQKLFMSNPMFMQRMLEKRATENSRKFPEAEREAKIKEYIADAKEFYKDKMREANKACVTYRLLRNVITDPYYRSHRASEISRVFDGEYTHEQKSLTLKLNMLAQAMGTAYNYLPNDEFIHDQEKYQGKLYFPAKVIQDKAGGEYHKNDLSVKGTKHAKIFEDLKKNDIERFSKLFRVEYQIEGDTDKCTEHVGRSVGVIANLPAIQDMEPEALKTMLMNMSETAKSQVEGQPPSEEEIEAAKNKNLEGLKQYKEVIKKHMRYMKKKYGAGYHLTDPRVLAAHMPEVQRDFCFLTDTYAMLVYMYKKPGVMDLNDPEENKLMSELMYYNFIGSAYMFAYRGLENMNESEDEEDNPQNKSYANVMKTLSCFLLLNLGSFAPEGEMKLGSFDPENGMKMMDEFEKPSQDVLWNELENGAQGPEMMEGDEAELQQMRKEKADWNVETGLKQLDDLTAAKGVRENADRLNLRDNHNLNLYKEKLRESEAANDQNKIKEYRNEINRLEKDIEERTKSITGLDKNVEDAQKKYDDAVAKFREKYGHEPTDDDIFRDIKDYSNYRKIFSEIEEPQKDVILTTEQLAEKFAS